MAELKQVNIDEVESGHILSKQKDRHMDYRLEQFIRRHGQINTLTTCRKGDRYITLAGSRVLELLKLTGAKTVTIYDLGELSEEEMFLISLNLSGYNYAPDYVTISEQLIKLNESMDLKTMQNSVPYDTSELDRMLNLLKFSWETFKGKSKIHENQTNFFTHGEAPPEDEDNAPNQLSIPLD